MVIFFYFVGKQFRCTECDFTAALRPHLLRHMEQHASFKVTPQFHFLFSVVMCPTAITKAQCFAFHSLSVVHTATTHATFQAR